MALVDDWPLFGLRIETPRLLLRYPTDPDLEQLNALADEGIHDPEVMPFAIPWTDDLPAVRRRLSLQFWWNQRAGWKPEAWVLPLVVTEGHAVVGVQDLVGKEFAVTRTVMTGSWLGKRSQGKGIGKEMRAAVLHLAFAGLGAQRATSGAFDDNAASLAVSRALGYVENGDAINVRRGKPARHINLLLDRATWERNRRSDIRIEGLEPCRSMFGI